MKGEGRQHPDMANVPGKRVNVAGEAGDLLIWHRLTPHGSSRNNCADPRMAMFFTLTPAQEEVAGVRAAAWREQWCGHGHGTDAVASTPLGRRLAGLEPW